MTDYYKRCPERILITALRKVIKNPDISERQRMEAMKLYAQVTGLVVGRKSKKKPMVSNNEPISNDRISALLASVEETKQ